MKKKDFIKSKLTISLIVLVVLSLSGIGYTLANKNKLAQAQNPSSGVSATSGVTPTERDIGKTYPREIYQGVPFNINLAIPGMKDEGALPATKADIMILLRLSGGYETSMMGTEYEYLAALNAAKSLAYIADNADNDEKLDYRIGLSVTRDGKDHSGRDSGENPSFEYHNFLGLTDSAWAVEHYIDDKMKAADGGYLRGEFALGTAWQKAVDEFLTDRHRPDAQKWIIFIGDNTNNVKKPAFYPTHQGESVTGYCNNVDGSGESRCVDWCKFGEECPKGEQGKDSTYLHNPLWRSVENQIRVIDIALKPVTIPSQTTLELWARIGNYGIIPNYDPSAPLNPPVNPYYIPVNTIAELQSAIDSIPTLISGDTSTGGAQIDVTETLAPGMSVDEDDITVKNMAGQAMNNNDINVGSDGRRVTIKFTIKSDFYIPATASQPEDQTFSLDIKNITYSGTGCFDADQNFGPNGEDTIPDASKPSKAYYTFLASGDSPVTKYMPSAWICTVTQYSGDIYGTDISNYAFPGIDVSVAGGTNSSSRVVWSLENYNFSGSSYSSYAKFTEHMDKVVADLEKRAKDYARGDPISNPNPDYSLNPGGGVWTKKGDLTISRPHTIGNALSNQRATIIVNGDLNFNSLAAISRPSGTNNNLLFIVRGNVNISPDVAKLENIAIIAYNKEDKGIINVGNSEMSIKGLLVGNKVVLLGGTTSGSQRINYDTSFGLYPPPGLSSIGLPIFKEVKP